jgi:hypothetical protein
VVPCRSGRRGDGAPVPGCVPTPPVGVGVYPGNGEVRDAQAEEPDVRLPGHGDLPGARAQPVGGNNEVEVFIATLLEPDPHPTPVVVQRDDAVPEAVGDPVAGVVVQDLRQIASQDLQFRGEAVAALAVAVTARDGEGCLGGAGGVDERETLFPGPGGPNLVLDAGAASDDAPGAAHVHVLATQAQLGRALYDGGFHAVAVQPVGERGAGDAGAGDEHLAGSHGAILGAGVSGGLAGCRRLALRWLQRPHEVDRSAVKSRSNNAAVHFMPADCAAVRETVRMRSTPKTGAPEGIRTPNLLIRSKSPPSAVLTCVFPAHARA